MKHDEGSNPSVEIYISNQNLDTDSCGHAKKLSRDEFGMDIFSEKVLI